MKIFLIGSGGREHAIADKIVNSPEFIRTNSTLYSTAGNLGIDSISKLIKISPENISELLQFALKEKIDLTIVGPEIPLSLGICDEFRKNNLRIFGPDKKAAEIETSKIFAKGLMSEYHIPTADFRSFEKSDMNDIKNFVNKIGYPVVIKADGLAAGKGVIFAENFNEVEETINDLTINKIFGGSGTSFIIEKFITGKEISLFIITDGKDYILLPSSQDHKRVNDNDEGKNTGGMGAFSPADNIFTDEVRIKAEERIIKPTLKALRSEGRNFIGCLYAGLIIDSKNDPYVIEFNCRFGDPETQCVLQLIDGDIIPVLYSTANSDLKQYKDSGILKLKKGYSVCVVLASGGYPDTFEKNKVISGLDRIDKDIKIFYSGVKNENADILTNGGRVLSLVSYSDLSLNDAISKVYSNIEKVGFDKVHYRKDIGSKGL